MVTFLNPRIVSQQIFWLTDLNDWWRTELFAKDLPLRYEYMLTAKGEAQKPILNAIEKWGEKFVPGSKEVLEK